MATVKQSIVLNDFSGGDLGYLRPAVSNDLSRFRALNVWRYPNGSIGPRPPLVRLTPSGTALITRPVYTFNSVLTNSVLVFDDGRAQYFSSGALATATGTATNPPSDAVSVGGRVVYVSSAGTGFTYSGGAITNVAAIPAATKIEKYKQRFVALFTNTLYFSAVNDHTTWPAANFFAVTDEALVEELWNQRNSLILPDSAGNIWRVSGVLGVNETLSRVDSGPFHNGDNRWPSGGSALGGDIWYRSGLRTINFNGAGTVTLPGIETAGVTDFGFVNDGYFLEGFDDDEFLWLAPSDSAASSPFSAPFNGIAITHHHTDGTFTQHQIPVSAYTPASGVAPVMGIRDPLNRGMRFLTNGAIGVGAKFYDFSPQVNFPLTTENDGDSGAPVSATYRSNDWWAPQGSEVTVSGVTIDYSAAPSVQDGALTMSIEALNPVDDNRVRTSASVEFTPETQGDFPDYNFVERGRKSFRFGEQASSGGFRLLIDDWSGIQIHQIIVTVDVTDARG